MQRVRVGFAQWVRARNDRPDADLLENVASSDSRLPACRVRHMRILKSQNKSAAFTLLDGPQRALR